MMDTLLHIANLFLLVSFSVKSMLWLRALNIVAGTFFICWASLAFDQPQWAMIAWNVTFGLMNIWRIWLAILERRPPSLSTEEQYLRQTVFSLLTPHAFRKLLNIGQWENGLPPDMLIESGQQPERVWMVAKGRIEVRRGDEIIRTIQAGDFVGEMSFLTSKPMNADVVICESIRCLSWMAQDLESFIVNEPEIGSALQRIFGQCLVRKINA
jgi:hypothetical protein